MDIRVDKKAVDVTSDRGQVRAELAHGSQHAAVIAVAAGIGERQRTFGVDHQTKVHANVFTVQRISGDLRIVFDDIHLTG